MVFGSFLENHSQKTLPSSEQRNTPPLLDRVLALFLDIFLHIPVFYLLLASFFRKMNILDVVVVSRSEYYSALFQSILLIVISSAFLNALYLKFWGATPGKYVMKMRVVGKDGEALGWGQSLLRSFIWWIQVFCFGLPFLEILSHAERRPIHDRAAETMVVTRKQIHFAGHEPVLLEALFIRSLLVGFFFVGMGWLTAWLTSERDQLVSGQSLVEEMQERGLVCSEIDAIASRTNKELKDQDARLEYTTALFLVEQIDADCFEREVDLSFLRKTEPTKAQYFARYLIEEKGSDQANNYKEIICKDVSDESCTSLKWYEATGYKQVSTFKPKNLLQAAIALRAATKWGDPQASLEHLKSVQLFGLQATSLVREQIQALSDLARWQEVEGAISVARSVVVETDLLLVTAEVCLQNLQTYCGNKQPVCNQFVELLESNPEMIEEGIVARATLKNSYCAGSLEQNMQYWALIDNSEVETLMHLIFKVKSSERKAEGLAALRAFIEDESQPKNLRYDGLQVLLKETSFSSDWKIAEKLWQAMQADQHLSLSSTRWMIYESMKRGQIAEFLKKFEGETYSPVVQVDLQIAKSVGVKSNRLPASVKTEGPSLRQGER